MSQSRTLYIGRDVPNDAMAVADVAPEHGAEVTRLGTIGTRQGDLAHLSRQLPSEAKPLIFAYAAGPCGSWRYRDLTQQGSDGWVVAPSLIPTKAGDRGTTDRRHAAPLARLARSGALPSVDGPQGEDEASRDLTRARAETLSALPAAKVRRTAFWRRHDSRYTGRATWTPAPLRWRSDVVWPTPAPQLVFQADVRAVNEPTARLPRLDQARQAQGTSWRVHPVVEALQALRGVQCTASVTTGAARGDLTRFDTPSERMKCLGLIPSE
jgi:transposase